MKIEKQDRYWRNAMKFKVKYSKRIYYEKDFEATEADIIKKMHEIYNPLYVASMIKDSEERTWSLVEVLIQEKCMATILYELGFQDNYVIDRISDDEDVDYIRVSLVE